MSTKTITNADGVEVGTVTREMRPSIGSLLGIGPENPWFVARDQFGTELAVEKRQRDAIRRVERNAQPLTAHSITAERGLWGGDDIITGVAEWQGYYVSAHRRVHEDKVYWLADFLATPASSCPVFANGTGCGTRPVAEHVHIALEDAYTASELAAA